MLGHTHAPLPMKALHQHQHPASGQIIVIGKCAGNVWAIGIMQLTWEMCLFIYIALTTTSLVLLPRPSHTNNCVYSYTDRKTQLLLFAYFSYYLVLRIFKTSSSASEFYITIISYLWLIKVMTIIPQAIIFPAEPPAITSSFEMTSANVSQTLSISCSAQAMPPLMWRWRHNAVDINSSMYDRDGSSSTLLINSLTEGDRGVYQCLVYQRHTGLEDSHNAFIDVNVKG